MASKPLCLVSAGHQARRRETNHSTNQTQNQRANRNSNSNRNKNWTGPKRQSNFQPMAPLPSAGKYDLVDYEDSDLISRKKKGKSVNHLLNFQSYENAPDAQSRDQNKRRTRTKSQRYRGSHGKEDYVQATGQFIVHESAALEFEPFLQNPNIHVPWKYIEAIRLYSQEKTNCPICMSPPIAGKAGRCGHAHCSSCILHLINIAEGKPQCPICHCNIVLNDLKSIICGDEIRPKINEKIELVKMKRGRDSINPVKNVPTFDAENWLDRHQRLIPVSTNDFVKNIIDIEEVQLMIQREECEDSEIPFVEQAQEMLRTRREHFQSLVSKQAPAPTTSQPVTQPTIQPTDDFNGNNPNLESSESDSNSDPEVIAEAESAESKNATNVDSDYYFYQASDGSPIFIASLNAKCLMSQYGSIMNGPEIISGAVLEIEDFTMDHELRRRFRYLSHLADGQPFSLVLLDSKDLNLNEDTFLKFKSQIVQRQKRKVQKDKEENKAFQKFEEFYDRELYGKYAPAEISLSSHEMFPDFEEDLAAALDQSLAEVSSAPAQPPTQMSSPTWVSRPKPIVTNDEYFPSLTGGAPTAIMSGQTGSFWGKPSVMPKSPKENNVSDLECGRPSTAQDIGSDIAQAIEAASNAAKKSIRWRFDQTQKGSEEKEGH
jgi:hypothetical protein